MFYDTFITDYYFKYSNLTDLAESREKNWYIMFKRLNNETKFADGKTINRDNEQSFPSNWKDELKNFLLMEGQVGGIVQTTTPPIFTDQDINDALGVMWDILAYDQNAWQTIGYDLLYKEVEQGEFYKRQRDGSVKMTGKVDTPAMWNGLKNEFVQGVKRLKWASQYNIDITSNTIDTKKTYDLTFRGSRKGKNNNNNFLRDIPFEEKTMLQRFHVGSIIDQHENTIIKNDGAEVELIPITLTHFKAKLKISKDALKDLIDSMMYSKLEATPVYESSRELLLPSEVLQKFETKGNLKIFLDDLKFEGARVVGDEIQTNVTSKAIKYHVWYGR